MSYPLRHLLAVLLLSSAGAAGAQEPASVRNWVDRPALFPGDTVTYQIEIHTDPRHAILPEALQAGRLDLTGLDVLSFEQQRTERDGGTRHLFRYRLTTYEVVPAGLGIGELRLPYYPRRPGQALDAGPPAGTLRVPPVGLALRSTLPGEPQALPLRDQSSAEVMAVGGAWLVPAGWGLTVIGALPLTLWALPGLRRRLQRRPSPARRRPSGPAPTVLDELTALDPESDTARRDGYERLDQALRDWLAEAAGPGTGALTAEELAARLQGQDLPIAAGELAAVLADCERSRYGGSGQLPQAGRFREGVTALQGLMARQ